MLFSAGRVRFTSHQHSESSLKVVPQPSAMADTSRGPTGVPPTVPFMGWGQCLYCEHALVRAALLTEVPLFVGHALCNGTVAWHMRFYGL